MYVCMYVCVFVDGCMNVSMHECMCIYMYVCMYVCVVGDPMITRLIA